MKRKETADVEIVRLVEADEKVTRGVLFVNNNILGCSLELPWKQNIRKVSCIPEGVYDCKRVYDRKTTGGLFIPTTFEVMNVDNRDGILFHVGNTVDDSQGCILVGVGYGILNKKKSIIQSRLGFQMFLEALAKVNEFTLRIRSDEYNNDC